MNNRKIWKVISRCISSLYYYSFGHLIAALHYKNTYITGKHFQSRFGGLLAPGWKWVVNDYFACKKMHKNKECPFPVSPFIKITHPENIIFDPDDLQNFQTDGCYYQAFGKITIESGTFIGPNVGLITANHRTDNPDEHEEPSDIKIGAKSWIGMNSIVLPGVTLGPGTIVGAGSVVTKSFPDGHCVVAGNPAKIIKQISTTEYI